MVPYVKDFVVLRFSAWNQTSNMEQESQHFEQKLNKRIRFDILQTDRIRIKRGAVQLSIFFPQTAEQFAAFGHLKKQYQ